MNMTHKRNTGPMMKSARCGAKTRKGHPCRSPAVKEKNAVEFMVVQREVGRHLGIRMP